MRLFDAVQQHIRCSVGAYLVLQYLTADLCQTLLHAGGIIETVAQTVLNRLVEYAQILLLTLVIEVAVGLGKRHILHHIVPQILHTLMGIGRT